MKRGRKGNSKPNEIGPVPPGQEAKKNFVVFTPLGSGQEVGRSCHLLQYKGKNVLLDCGLHPGKKGMDALPFFDAENIISPSEIDVVLITHFHVDHVAALPYFTEKTNFKGDIYMTRPTRVVSELLLMDYVRVVGTGGGDQLFSTKDVENCMKKVRLLDYHQEINVGGIRFTAFVAGHVLGAAMFLIEIADIRILYTGDFSREEDRHLLSAEVPHVNPDILISESTFGIMLHENREKREEKLTTAITDVLERGGQCLVPVFSLGRAQELLLILEDYWKRHPWLHKVRIYHNSRVATKALEVYKTYINVMNDHIRIENRQSNPWQFDYIYPLFENVDSNNEPMVIMASPGMIQNGKSREIFERLCTDEKNGVILTGYSVEGTLAHQIGTTQVKQFQSMEGHLLDLKCEVKTISFAAHSDFRGTKSFIEEVKASNIVLVHGNRTQMTSMKRALEEQLAGVQGFGDLQIHMPSNTQVVKFEMFEERVVKAVGELAAEKSCEDGTRLAGVLVRHDFQEQLVLPEDMEMYTQLSTAAVTQQLHLPFHSSFERLLTVVGKLFEVGDVAVDTTQDMAPVTKKGKSKKTKPVKVRKVVVCGTVSLTHTEPPGRVLMEWESCPSYDMIADAIIALVMRAEGGIEGIRLSGCCSTKHSHDCSEDHKQNGKLSAEDTSGFHILSELLMQHFGEKAVECVKETGSGASADSFLKVTNWKNSAVCNIRMNSHGEIVDMQCEEDQVHLDAVNELVKRVKEVVYPISLK